MQVREIDIFDLIIDVLSHWRGLVVALLTGAVLMVVVSYARSYQTIENTQTQEAFVQDESTVQRQLDQIEKSLDDTQKAAVLAVLDDEKKYALKKTYAENSVYMQIDPLRVAQTELVYQIQMKDGTANGQLGALYETLINNVGLYNWVSKQVGIDASYVGELISVENVSSMAVWSGTQDIWQEVSFGTDCVKLTIFQTNTDTCQKLAEAVKRYITDQQEELSIEQGEYDLVLVSETIGTAMNKDMLENQIECGQMIVSLQTAMARNKAEFTEEQKRYYELLTWKDAEQEVQSEQLTEEHYDQAPLISKKYVLFGSVLFAFTYVIIVCIAYIVNPRLRISDELQKLYHIPQIGLIINESSHKFFLDRWINKVRYCGKRIFSAEQSLELAFAAVKIATVKNGLNSICLMGCNMSAGAGKVCETLKAALEKEQINVIILNNVLYDAESMEKMDAMQGAVLVEKAGSTLYSEIADELELLKRQEIKILGGIIVD